MTRVPTLSTAGWVSDVANMAVKLMDYFITSDVSQSQLYRGEITSLRHLVQRHGSNPTYLEEHVRTQLSNYLSRYFDDVQVNTRTTGLDVADGRYTLVLDVMLSKDSKQHSLGRLIEIGESKIIDVADAAN